MITVQAAYMWFSSDSANPKTLYLKRSSTGFGGTYLGVNIYVQELAARPLGL